MQELSNITITSTICLFISYGLFVGYSIAYEEELQEYGGT
ncbi:YqhR family membrane protein [Geomicrobium sp. JCM 19055]|nr:YqhR family membrane protein [Geomicrobium sp. JCM 19055]